jgi:hypothetical protein
MRSAASPLAELAAAALPAAAGGIFGGGASHIGFRLHRTAAGICVCPAAATQQNGDKMLRPDVKFRFLQHILPRNNKTSPKRCVTTCRMLRTGTKKTAPLLMLHKESPKHIASGCLALSVQTELLFY